MELALALTYVLEVAAIGWQDAEAIERARRERERIERNMQEVTQNVTPRTQGEDV